MSARERILEALSDGRVWQATDLCRQAECHRIQIKRAVDSGEVATFGGGLVCRPELAKRLADRHFDVHVAMHYPGGVLCLEGAVRYWGLGEVSNTQVMVPALSSYTSLGCFPATVVRTRIGGLLEIGVDVQELTPDLTFRVTGLERTVCDLYTPRFQDFEVRTKALHAYLDLKGRTPAAMEPLFVMASQLKRCTGREYCRDLQVALTTIPLEESHPAPANL